MKNLIRILFISLVLISCSRSDENSENSYPLVTKMNVTVFNANAQLYNQAELNLTFEYNSSKQLTKRIGGFLQTSGSSGFSVFFTDKIYTSLSYSNNIVTVEDFSTSSDFTVPKNSKYFTLNSNNQVAIKEIPNINVPYNSKKLIFSYANNKLSEIKTTLPNMPYDATDPSDYVLTYLEKFYYDANGNLSKTEYFEQQNGINKGEKIVRTFEDYDNSNNPCKKFLLLDEFFYRALSKNNYRKYTEVHYNYDSITSTYTINWTFSYDSNGQIILN